MKKFITFLIVLGLLVAGVDHSIRVLERRRLGPGLDLKPHQLVLLTLCDDIHPREIRKGDTIRFRPKPGTQISSTAMGDSALANALVLAEVVDAGPSETFGAWVVLFQPRKLQLADGRLAEFKGSVFSPDDPNHLKESGILGSFVGMEFGPVGVISGFLGGLLFPFYHGKLCDPPLNCAVGDVKAGTALMIKVTYAEYLPFAISGSSTPRRGTLNSLTSRTTKTNNKYTNATKTYH